MRIILLFLLVSISNGYSYKIEQVEHFNCLLKEVAPFIQEN